jgi:uncharacterized protein YjbJ (UPF0337 family)
MKEADMATDNNGNTNNSDATRKVHNAAQDAAGHVKETAGKVTGNADLEAEGQNDQTAAHLKQAGQNVKDAFTG